MNQPLVPGHYVVLSFDDGIVDDRRLVQLLNAYGLRATFFLNGLFDENSPSFEDEGATVFHLPHRELPTLYAGHEIGVHTWSHPYLPNLSDDDVRQELSKSREWITGLFGEVPYGFAYPFGGYDQRLARIIQESGFHYARTIHHTNDYSLSLTPFMLHPHAHIRSSQFYGIVEDFLATECNDAPLVLHLWGHSYEFTGHNEWEEFERRLQFICSKKIIKNVILGDIY